MEKENYSVDISSEDKNSDLDFYDELAYKKGDIRYNLKLYFKYVKRVIKTYIREKSEKRFINVLYVTQDCPNYSYGSKRLDSPIDYITEIRNQYPEINIELLVPIIGLSENDKISKNLTLEYNENFVELKKLPLDFEIYAQNKNWECSLYKYEKNEYNIDIYGIYSPAFSYVKSLDELTSFETSVFFMKAVRAGILKLSKKIFKPDIIHSDGLPFYVGSEFENKFPFDIKVFQIFDNFVNLEASKQEPFWSAINIADKTGMKKIRTDSIIQNNISRLFSLSVKDIAPKMLECVDLIYSKYKSFHASEIQNSESTGDVVFRYLNNRIAKIFPNFLLKGDIYFYPFLTTLYKADIWAVYSKKYYKDLIENKQASPKIINQILKNEDKSFYVLPGIDTEKHQKEAGRKIYYNFDNENWREERIKNKKTLIKEFSADRIKTNFIDKTMFDDYENTKIYGYLDSFYDSVLLFANPEPNIYGEGIDILLATILKLFERNKNVQVIIGIKDGIKQNYIKSYVDFLCENRIFMGRWVFIDGGIELPKFLSGSDIFLYSPRLCSKSLKHLLGMYYGCVPVTSNTGILNDTVIDIFDNLAEGNGFVTKEALLYEDENSNYYVNTLSKAIELYINNPAGWNTVIKNCLSTYSGWNIDKLAVYNKIYRELI